MTGSIRTSWVAILSLVASIGPACAQDAKQAKDPGLTGSVSEERFKAMHQLKTDQPPTLQGAMIDLPNAKAYLSLPPKAQPPIAGIVVIQEWWGLNDHIKHWADRLAAEGYAAIAVDLYDGKVATSSDDAMKYMQTVKPEEATAKLLAGYEFLAKDSRIQAKQRGSIGWCFGGYYSLRLAMAAPDLNACVMYYGRPVLEVEELKKIKAPLLGVFANKDESIPPAVVDQLDAALTKAGVKHEILRYDADHAFANPSNAIYDEKAAADAWKHVQAFFAANLKNGAKK